MRACHACSSWWFKQWALMWDVWSAINKIEHVLWRISRIVWFRYNTSRGASRLIKHISWEYWTPRTLKFWLRNGQGFKCSQVICGMNKWELWLIKSEWISVKELCQNPQWIGFNSNDSMGGAQQSPIVLDRPSVPAPSKCNWSSLRMPQLSLLSTNLKY